MSYAIICPHGKKEKNGRIGCRVSGALCAHVFYCQLQSRWKQTPAALSCPGREEKKDG